MDKPKDAKNSEPAPETGAPDKAAEYKESLQRLQAEFENYKKRTEKEKAQFKQFASAEVVKGFLPVLDSFELALKSINNVRKEDAANDVTQIADAIGPSRRMSTWEIVKGLEMIYGQFYSALESHGLRPIKAVGEKFDPYKHEVLMQGETDDAKKDGMVAEEFQKGYMVNDIIIRYSKVKVLKFKNEKDESKLKIMGGN